MAITGTVQDRLSAYLPHMHFLLQRPACDRLTILAAHVTLMAYQHLAVNMEKVGSSSQEFNVIFVLKFV